MNYKDNEEGFKIPKGNYINIVVTDQDKDFIKITQNFLDELEKSYNVFQNKLKEEEKKWKKITLNVNYYLIPESLSKKSPLTIINAPWGSGKTYFIEKMIENLNNKKISSKIFKKIIVLDVWKYSTYDNIPNEIMTEFFNILFDQMNVDEKLKKNINNSINSVFNKLFNVFSDITENKIGIKIGKKTTNIVEELEKINKNIEPTIVIFDNLERIGPKSWEILKAIFKISQLENLVFVLPMNINMLENNTISNSEYSIEKFIDLTFFNLKQDYFGLLLKMNFNEKESSMINKLLNQEIKGEKLTIRQVEQGLRTKNVQKKNNFFLKFKTILEEIWGDEENAINILKEYVKESFQFEQFYSRQLLLHDEFCEIILDEKYDSEFLSNEELIKLIDEYDKISFSFSFDYYIEWNKMNQMIEDEKKIIMKTINEKETQKKQATKSITHNTSLIEQIKNKTDKIKNKILLEGKNELPDQEKIIDWKKAIDEYKKNILEKKEIIKEKQNELSELEESISELKFYEKWNDFEKIEKISNEFKNNIITWCDLSKEHKIIYDKVVALLEEYDVAYKDKKFNELLSKSLLEINIDKYKKNIEEK